MPSTVQESVCLAQANLHPLNVACNWSTGGWPLLPADPDSMQVAAFMLLRIDGNRHNLGT